MQHKKTFFKFLRFSLSFIIILAAVFFIYIQPYRSIPILTYHSISNIDRKFEVISLESGIFQKQMSYLFKHKYKVLTLKEALKSIQSGKMAPRHCVVLTFDDGFADFYSRVYPVIKKYDFKVTVFVYVDEIGKNKNKLSWDLLRELKKSGLVDIASHSFSHRPLTTLSESEVRWELEISQSILKEKIGETSPIFSYPFGALNSRVKKIVKDSGYIAAVGTAYQRGGGVNSDTYALRRIFVSRFSDSPFVFKFMLSGYYLPTFELLLKIFNIHTPRDVKAANIKNALKPI